MIKSGDYYKYLKNKTDWEVVNNNPGGDFKVEYKIPMSKPETVFGIMDNPGSFKSQSRKECSNCIHCFDKKSDIPHCDTHPEIYTTKLNNICPMYFSAKGHAYKRI